MSPSAKARPRDPLSRDRVLLAALRLADAEGIHALTMRGLATTLGVEAMSLYHHVSNKEDILDGIVDLVLTEIDLPPADGDWRQAVRRTVVSAHDVLVRHPWACRLLLSPARIRPARVRYMDVLLGLLRRAGFTAEQTHLAYHALDSHIVGFTLWEAAYTTEAPELRDFAPRFLAQLSADDFPYLVEHVRYHVDGADGPDEFAFGLDLILDGLERLRARAGTAAVTGQSKRWGSKGPRSQGVPPSRARSAATSPSTGANL